MKILFKLPCPSSIFRFKQGHYHLQLHIFVENKLFIEYKIRETFVHLVRSHRMVYVQHVLWRILKYTQCNEYGMKSAFKFRLTRTVSKIIGRYP